MEKRNLTAAYKFYCDKNLENAHSALADTRATLDVLVAQIERYEGEEVLDGLGNKMGKIANDVQSVDRLSQNKSVDLAGRMIYKNGTEVFNFGKHRGKPVAEVLQNEPSFYDWILKGDFPLETKRRLTQIKLRSFGK